MSRRATSALAWSIGFASLALALASLVLWVVTGGTQGSLSIPAPGIAIAFPLVGALIAARRPENPVGWVMLMVGVGGALTLASGVYGYAALISRPSLPGEDWAYWVSSWVWTVAFFPLVTILVPIFPTGRLPSRRWRPVLVAAVVVLATVVVCGAFVDPIRTPSLTQTIPNPIGVGGPALATIESIAYVTGLVLMVLCVVGLVLRYRRSTGVLRLQLSWFTWAFAVAVFFLIVNFMAAGPNGEDTTVAAIAGVLMSAGFAFVAVGVGIAVLRYRLYDIGRIINRTIVYALLTAVLVGLYAAIVVGIGSLLDGRSSPVLIAAATLVVAALAGPARRRIQTLIDRRFYRRRYDAERVLAEFGSRLRDEVDVDELRRLLGTTAERTVQPERVGVWIRGVDS
jgi:hypothetical protein